MRLLIIRHGDPDYANDTLTAKGWKEAEYLSERISALNIKDFYVSPLGRAKDTASLTLKKMNRSAVEYEWLREFAPRIYRPDSDTPKIVWDWLPQDWSAIENFYRYDEWTDNDILRAGKVKEEYDWVITEFDRLLAKHGYVRAGHIYRVEHANNDILAFFCHYGVGCVLISHLINVSPMVLWHGLCAAPTAVADIVTEERRKGSASFRMLSYGDVAHLYAHAEAPSTSARFCETYDNMDERHD